MQQSSATNSSKKAEWVVKHWNVLSEFGYDLPRSFPNFNQQKLEDIQKMIDEAVTTDETCIIHLCEVDTKLAPKVNRLLANYPQANWGYFHANKVARARGTMLIGLNFRMDLFDTSATKNIEPYSRKVGKHKMLGYKLMAYFSTFYSQLCDIIHFAYNVKAFSEWVILTINLGKGINFTFTHGLRGKNWPKHVKEYIWFCFQKQVGPNNLLVGDLNLTAEEAHEWLITCNWSPAVVHAYNVLHKMQKWNDFKANAPYVSLTDINSPTCKGDDGTNQTLDYIMHRINQGRLNSISTKIAPESFDTVAFPNENFTSDHAIIEARFNICSF
jgi:hypothetical protein